MRLFTTMMQFIYNRAKKDKKRIINELCLLILHTIVKKKDNVVKKNGQACAMVKTRHIWGMVETVQCTVSTIGVPISSFLYPRNIREE